MSAPPVSPLKRTVVLSSRENFVWHSMQEIIPALEESWRGTAEPGVHEVLCIDADQARLADYLPRLFSASLIVLTCFTVRLARLATLLRQEMRLEVRYAFHLHSQATYGCWPLHQWGLGGVLRESDVLISSCSRDTATLSLSFETFRVKTIPFSLPALEGKTLVSPHPDDREGIPLVYIGRISEQKNLHVLLLALKLLREMPEAPRFRLAIYGEEDGLGSPNMGFGSEGYLDFLRRLVKDLGLDSQVRFEGHLDREELYRRLEGKKHIFVSASLHSDENFGMAAFRSLCLGHQAVLTRWGGHEDFSGDFPESLVLVDVLGSTAGPFVDPYSFGHALRDAARLYPRTFPAQVPERCTRKKIETVLQNIALGSTQPGPFLVSTPLARRILEKRGQHLQDSVKGCKIFLSYTDPDAQPFFRGYGMKEPSRAPFPKGPLLLAPWVKVEDDFVEVHDPHRGHFIIRSRGGDFRRSPTLDFRGRALQLDAETAEKLFRLGYAWGQP